MLPGLSHGLAKHRPVYAVVENLGTNDALQGGRHADWQTSWTQLLTSTAAVPCLVLTTINVLTDLYGKQPVASTINRQISELVNSNPTRYKVVDWNGFVTELLHSKSANYVRYMRLDAIHEKSPGARWLANEDQTALSDCGSSVEPPVIPPS
jgi:hypothetical protein